MILCQLGSVSMKSVRGLSVMWGVNCVGREWPFFVKTPEFSRKNVIAFMPSLVPRRPGRYSICDTLRKAVRCLS